MKAFLLWTRLSEECNRRPVGSDGKDFWGVVSEQVPVEV
jgi:hypothetical protein